MCLSNSKVKSFNHWNWDGDRIVHDPIVPSSRPVVDSDLEYDIDPREFLVSEKNAVIKRVLGKEIKKILGKKGTHLSKELFLTKKSGAFDYRVRIIMAYVSDKIKYVTKSGRDSWQFPDETLKLQTGDCEDIAFVIASLMTASGISPYNVRVALGKIHVFTDSQKETFDHVWVMYKNENGFWSLLEPHTLVGQELKLPNQTLEATSVTNTQEIKNIEFEYEPFFVFNQDHVWSVKNPVHKEEARKNFKFDKNKWKKLNPKFHGEIHQKILHEALSGNENQEILKILDTKFKKAFFIFGPIVDEIDNTLIHKYHPFEHFDNGYIAESWNLVEKHLVNFRRDNSKLDEFALAAHAISDFYAHTSYAHFFKKTGDKATLGPIFDIETFNTNPELLVNPLDYETDPVFSTAWTNDFSVNDDIYHGSKETAKVIWAGKIISGRYAQNDDTRSGIESHLTEGTTFIPKSLEDAPDFNERGSLPHHNEIAVDQDIFDKALKHGHVLYKTEAEFNEQFLNRKQLAINHIRKEFIKAVR